MKLHNTLTRKTEDFKPAQGNTVKLYTCGPTVYDFAHIGNLRSFVFDDTLRRVLQAANFDVRHVMNITDVGHLVSDADEGEDKLEKGAQREGKTVWDVAKQYTEAFKQDMQTLNILPPNAYQGSPDGFARATDFIPQQIAMVQALLDKGFAYQTKQAIYFDVAKLPDYGKLSGQKLADKDVAVRSEVVTDPEKHSPHDFAVWFFATGHFAGHTMRWDSPWGEGFPGWHLECSAIIHATLGDPIDIHTGGVDHIGTHHANEMAQTQAAFGHELSHVWMHNEFILVDGGKMSKSKGNFYTLKDIIDKGFDPMALRLLYLQAHYRSQLNFTWESLEGAQNRLQNWKQITAMRWQVRQPPDFIGIDNLPESPEAFKELEKNHPHTITSAKLMDQITHALQDDLDTPTALAAIDSFMSLVEKEGMTSFLLFHFTKLLQLCAQTLGIDMFDEDITSDQKAILAERQQARDAKDWTTADTLRDKLQQQGIGVRDTAYGQVWLRS